jgi:hypothetical protein
MKTLLLFIATISFALPAEAQKIELKQTESIDDVRVHNGDYILHFKPIDVVAAISKIDSVSKGNNSAIATSIKENELKFVDLKGSSDKAFVDLLKSNLGSYLIVRGKVAIYKAGMRLTSVMADESPEIVELDGSSRVHIAFTEGNDEAFVFIGQLNTKLKPAK